MVFKDWKISTFNGALVASYFIPAWAIPAFRIVASPVHGLFYERANVAAGMYVSDYLQFGAVGIIRFAWLLALAKLTVVAFFVFFLAMVFRVPTRNRGAADEALTIALALGGLVSFVSMLLAAKIGEPMAMKLHATELLLMVSIGIVSVFEAPAARPVAVPATEPVAQDNPEPYKPASRARAA
jgi:hypothetical protein